MSLSATLQALQADQSLRHCANLPAGPGYVLVPALPPFRCPTPCGGVCKLAQNPRKAPPPTPPELRLRLRLADTLAALVTDATRPDPPVACVGGPDATPRLLEGLRPGQN